MLTKYDENDQMRLEKIQDRHFLEIKKPNSQEQHMVWGGEDWGIGWGIGVYRGRV